MSEQPERAPRDAETVPVPDKGGWIDGETGQVIPMPAAQPKSEPQPKAEPAPEPKKKAS